MTPTERGIIKRLSYDKIFGILTRPALEMELEQMDKFNCCLIDLNNLRTLNKLIGYHNVNDKIFSIFNKFQAGHPCIIGRWFSGDEILIVDDAIYREMVFLRVIAYEHGISFKTKYFIDTNYQCLEKGIEECDKFD